MLRVFYNGAKYWYLDIVGDRVNCTDCSLRGISTFKALAPFVFVCFHQAYLALVCTKSQGQLCQYNNTNLDMRLVWLVLSGCHICELYDYWAFRSLCATLLLVQDNKICQIRQALQFFFQKMLTIPFKPTCWLLGHTTWILVHTNFVNHSKYEAWLVQVHILTFLFDLQVIWHFDEQF